MKKLLALLALVTALLVAGCGSGTSSSGTSTMQTVDASAFLATAAEPGVTVIDVRTPQEYAEGHLDGAINIDVESSGFADQIAALDKNATYEVYCRSGRRSAVAGEQMTQSGFATVYNLDGGLADLQSAGGRIVS